MESIIHYISKFKSNTIKKQLLIKIGLPIISEPNTALRLSLKKNDFRNSTNFCEG